MYNTTLKIFLPEGEATGTKIVELSNWIGKGFFIPRNKLKEVLKRPELASQSVYFLIGDTDEGKKKVYIGEAENFNERIEQHHKNKDFWNIVICFISKDENLTKAHVKFLEGWINTILQISRQDNIHKCHSCAGENPDGYPFYGYDKLDDNHLFDCKLI